MADPRTPNFFVVGAPKAGTTALCRYLEQHDAVYMSPIKEPCFFAPEIVTCSDETRAKHERDKPAVAAFLAGPMNERRQSGFVTEWADYLKLFRHAADASAIGEGSVAYLGSLVAPRAIRQRIAHARIVMVLRDPVDRLFSHYKAARAMGRTALSLADWADEQRRIEETRDVPWGSIWAGRYARQVARYLDVFGESSVHVILYEDFVRDDAGTLAGVFRFLGVDPTRRIDTATRYNVTAVPRWSSLDRRPLRRVWRAFNRVAPVGVIERVKAWSNGASRVECTPDDRARVIATHAEEIRALERLIRRDLSAWQSV